MTEQTPAHVDLNADLGEEAGDDTALLDIVTSANVAAGAHAGGGDVLHATIAAAGDRGVNVGAHISYPDRENFGRVSLLSSVEESALPHVLCEQILTVHRAAEHCGVRLTHVKAHGALYNDAAADPRAAVMVLAAHRMAAQALGRTLPAMGMPGTALHAAAARTRVPFIKEAFADRAYTSDGLLVPRSEPGAVLDTTRAVVDQAIDIAVRHRVTTIHGSRRSLTANSLCVHGDTPGAVAHAREIRAALTAAGATVSGFALRAAR